MGGKSDVISGTTTQSQLPRFLLRHRLIDVTALPICYSNIGLLLLHKEGSSNFAI